MTKVVGILGIIIAVILVITIFTTPEEKDDFFKDEG